MAKRGELRMLTLNRAGEAVGTMRIFKKWDWLSKDDNQAVATIRPDEIVWLPLVNTQCMYNG